MPKFNIPVEWAMFAVIEIEADNLDEAVALAYVEALPDNAEYLANSYRVIEEELDLYNEEPID